MLLRSTVLSVAAAFVFAAAPASAQQGGPPAAQAPAGEVKAIGPDRYQIGRIVVDKAAGSFTVPARVLVLDKPLEYLATSPGGMKDYETLLEVPATGTEFNLACILIGLERSADELKAPLYHSVPELRGPRVTIQLSWMADGQRRTVPAAQALLNPDSGIDPAGVAWVYVGAPASDALKGRFATDETGTLIGFIHDANAVIESVRTLGLGAYGSVRGHTRIVPPVGTAVDLIVTRVRPAQ